MEEGVAEAARGAGYEVGWHGAGDVFFSQSMLYGGGDVGLEIYRSSMVPCGVVVVERAIVIWIGSQCHFISTLFLLLLVRL